MALVLGLAVNTGVVSEAAADSIRVPLLHLRVAGGMPAPGGLASSDLMVTVDGSVMVREFYHPKDFGSGKPAKKKTYQLPNLNARVLAEVKKTVESLKGGELVEPDQPGCMDAPRSEYSIFKDWQKTVVYMIDACRPFQLRDESQRPAANKIRELLAKLLAKTHERSSTTIN